MRKNSSSSLFLMELILAILFFSLASTVCIKLFIQSHLLSKSSVELNNAVLWCQNFAEGFDGCSGDISKLNFIFPEINKIDDFDYIMYFDDNWQIKEGDFENSTYYIKISQIDDAPLCICHICCSRTDSDKCIYEIDVKKYISKEASRP